MSVITLLTRKAPTIAGIEFDAILEDTLEAPVTFTDYPIESGARAIDHGVLEPYRWSLLISVSNNPLNPQATDFLGGLLSNIVDNNIITRIAGLSAGLLSSSDESRGAAALELLLALRLSRESFDIDAGDIQLSNMAISNIIRTKTPENEQGLFARVFLQELSTIDTVLSPRAPQQSQLREGDPSQSQIAAAIERGEQALSDVGDSINNTINGLFG